MNVKQNTVDEVVEKIKKLPVLEKLVISIERY
jgi:hypothetical protein